LKLDSEFLRQHYASLSDETLGSVRRSDLVEAAQKYYDDECARRGLTSEQDVPDKALLNVTSATPNPLAAEIEFGDDAADGGTPSWAEEAACVCSYADYPRTHFSPQAAKAHDVLRAAGVPCYVAAVEIPPEPPSPHPQFEYRVLVPSTLNLKAISVLDKEIFNAELEADWRTHFETLSDGELDKLRPEVVCAGWVDRIQRLTKAYEAEVARRRNSPSASQRRRG
jgi:hypothetical protein